MDVGEYERYTIKLTGGEITSIELGDHKINKFSSPASKNNLPKIYMIKSGAEIVYVGITSQSLRPRLQSGLHAKGEHGYYGYKWKDLNQIELNVFYFPGSTLSSVEPIEAEIAYLVRQHIGDWPKYQIEIHFHQSSRQDKELAAVIYKECMKQ